MDVPSLPGASSTSSSTPARPRKRIARPGQWKRNEAKAKRARGESYASATTGQEVEAAQQGSPCTCQRKCFEKFSADELKRIFDCFWGLGDKNLQDAYLHGLIRVRKIERRRPRSRGGSRTVTPRSATYMYVVSIMSMPMLKPCEYVPFCTRFVLMVMNEWCARRLSSTSTA